MIEEQILNTIKKYNLIEKNDKIICGISGGPDSICMLDVLRKIKQELDLEKNQHMMKNMWKTIVKKIKLNTM